MKSIKTSLKIVAVLALAVSFTGCESTDGGGSVSGGVYYGVGMYDPFYYGSYYYDDPDIIVTPPDRPDRPVHPEQPIARPPSSNVRPTPMPTIPSAPRPMPRARGR
jgi:predicted small secreted protein